MLISAIWILPFNTTFTDLDLAGRRGERGGGQVSTKHNLLASFSHTLSSEQEEIWCGDEAVQSEHPETSLE